MRIAITTTGAALLACGTTGLAFGFGAFGLADAPPFHPALVEFATGSLWFLPVLTGVAEAVALAGQLWLITRLRSAVQQWRPDLDARTRERARAAADVLDRDARNLPGVEDVRIRLTGSVQRPRLRMTVVCAGDALLGEVYGELGAGPVERYRREVGMPDLPAVIRFRLTFPRPGRRRPRLETAGTA
ncbi:hypothetical protein [Actinomadura algeriensis]|uniref:Alkaline shock response membrane anchor protein AmaP n=1 Tax=Actinomadura algeriensis TaxID=1679523 RepID=A0ABR9JKF4_9ACTN|nr:hypothetical protein [Actinomadura algeriensis]MBE1531022.1 hypothetical protein [Actinomadura algeriensis]